MRIDFHYYAAYCAAVLAGYSHEESLAVAVADEYTDDCTRTSLKRMKAPLSAATAQTQMEMMDVSPGPLSLQDITRIWSSFHFLPGDLYADPGRGTRAYLRKYRLICRPNGALLKETAELAKRDGSLQAAGIAMHILSDTWAHQYFAGTPSAVINNASGDFRELLPGGEERPVVFRHKVSGADDLENGRYTGSILQFNEQSVMCLGHGRVGHLPDYSFMRYRYLPAWGDYEEIFKDNPSDFLHAFAQMLYALRWLRCGTGEFVPDTYDWETLAPVRAEVEAILRTRQLDPCGDWKALGERLSGREIPAYSPERFEREYIDATGGEKDLTGPGRFIYAALNQKSMVTKRIFESGSLLAGLSVDFSGQKLKGIKDFHKLVESMEHKMRRTDK